MTLPTLKERAAADNKIMFALKVTEIRHILARTNKGELDLMLKYGGTENNYTFVLDAVPFDAETNKQLMSAFEGVLYSKEPLDTIE